MISNDNFYSKETICNSSLKHLMQLNILTKFVSFAWEESTLTEILGVRGVQGV